MIQFSLYQVLLVFYRECMVPQQSAQKRNPVVLSCQQSSIPKPNNTPVRTPERISVDRQSGKSHPVVHVPYLLYIANANIIVELVAVLVPLPSSPASEQTHRLHCSQDAHQGPVINRQSCVEYVKLSDPTRNSNRGSMVMIGRVV